MTTEDQKPLLQLVEINQRRLHVLQTQKAQYGSLTPPHVVLDIEDTEKEIARLQRLIAGEQAIAVELFSFNPSAQRASAALRLDWTPFFNPLPPAESWQATLLPQLDHVRRDLDAQYADPIIALRIRAHLTVGLLVGYVFRATTGFRLWVEQPTDGREPQWWRTDDEVGKNLALQVQTRPVTDDGQDTVIALSISRDVQPSAEQWMQAMRPSIHEVVQISPRSGIGKMTVQDGAQALAMAYQIESAIISARDARPSGVIHLLGAMPIGLAVLIGTRLNRCGPIQCYEHTSSADIYAPSWRLE